jgi:hypothetical protein
MIQKGTHVMCIKTPTTHLSCEVEEYRSMKVPVKGKVYTVRGIMVDSEGDMILTLEEVRNKKFRYLDMVAEPHFKHYIFREMALVPMVKKVEKILELVENLN